MRALVDLQVFRARKQLTAAGKRTRERLFSRMHANVVDELVFGLKRELNAYCPLRLEKQTNPN